MPRAPTSLIARLRARPAAWVWLFALVVASKCVLGSLCLADGVYGVESAALATVQAAPAVAVSDVHDDDSSSCWHAGSGGCHCSCVHGSALPAIASIWPAVPATKMKKAPQSAPVPLLALTTELRPPIA